jgi:glutathione S-transferase
VSEAASDQGVARAFATMRGTSGVPRMAKLLVKPSSLAALAGALLALGLLVYLADRPAGQAMLLPAWPRLADGAWFGSAGHWLPSFVHPLAFSLLTVAALGPSPRPRYGVCVAWGALNAAFELGQLPQVATAIAAALHDSGGPATPSRALADYFVHGRFDAADLAAVALGSVAAAILLRLRHDPNLHHAP